MGRRDAPHVFVQKIKIFFVFCTKNHNFATDMSKINPYEELIRIGNIPFSTKKII